MFRLQLVKDYLKHQFKGKSRHGVHSPFVYHLVDQVIYNSKADNAYQDIEKLRSELFHDKRTIRITDLGAGSLVNNNKLRKVSVMARSSLKPPFLAQLIYRLAKNQKPENIIELGTCLGTTTAYLAKGAPKAKVISIEGCPETALIAAENLKKLNIHNVDLQVGDFDELLPEILKDIPKLDFIFIDGNHRKNSTLSYFYSCLPKVTEDSLMIFDDIYWSEGMKEAWEEIKAHPEVTVTVDLFRIGLVYFKKTQAKENFRIRL